MNTLPGEENSKFYVHHTIDTMKTVDREKRKSEWAYKKMTGFSKDSHAEAMEAARVFFDRPEHTPARYDVESETAAVWLGEGEPTSDPFAEETPSVVPPPVELFPLEPGKADATVAVVRTAKQDAVARLNEAVMRTQAKREILKLLEPFTPTERALILFDLIAENT